MQFISKDPPKMEIKKSTPRAFLVALKNSNLNTLILAECVIFCTFLDVKCRKFQKWPQNYCICHSLQSGANFPEIAIGYGSPGTEVKLLKGVFAALKPNGLPKLEPLNVIICVK